MINRGISLRKLNIVILIAAAVISIVLFIVMSRTSKLYDDNRKFTEQFMEWKNASSDLMRASDYLTEQMQDYTVTGDRAYLDNYFTEAKVTKRRENSLQVLSQGNTRSAAYINLSAAMDESMSLMEREYYAARLTIMAYGYDISDYPEEIQAVKIMTPDTELSAQGMKDMAMLMMHGEEYRKSKEVISSHIDECLKELDNEMKAKQDENADKLKSQMLLEHILTIILVILLLCIVLSAYQLVIKPLKYSVDLIRDEQDLPVSGAYEIRFLAKTYNLIHHTNLQSKEKLTYAATHDKLTNLYNRRGYDFLLENIDIETSALLLFDIDEFKSVNDTYGHDMGDKLLIKVAEIIFNNFRAQDYICRIGGDEMAVLMVHSEPNLSSLIESKVKKINKALSEIKDDEPAVSVSCGVAFGDSTTTPEILFKRADECLYEVKNGEKQGISIYKAEKKKKK